MEHNVNGNVEGCNMCTFECENYYSGCHRSAGKVILKAVEVAGVCCPECCVSHRKCHREYKSI
jgi:hypothetical protein